jgi:hypothetical protein
LYFWIRLCDWSEAIHDFAIRAKWIMTSRLPYRFWSFLVVFGPLCFVLCALCFVLCALCFVLCALCFVLCALCFVLCALWEFRSSCCCFLQISAELDDACY